MCLLPQRYIMALLLFFGVLTNFTIRISFKLALNQLVVPANVSRFTNKNDICYYNETQKQSSPVNTSVSTLGHPSKPIASFSRRQKICTTGQQQVKPPLLRHFSTGTFSGTFPAATFPTNTEAKSFCLVALS